MSLLKLLYEEIHPKKKNQLIIDLVKTIGKKAGDDKDNIKKYINNMDSNPDKKDFEYFIDNIINLVDPTTSAKYSKGIIRKALLNDDRFKLRGSIVTYELSKWGKKIKEDAPKFNQYLELFHRHKKKLDKTDINQIKNFHELYELVKPFIKDVETNLEELKKILDDNEYEEIINVSEFYNVYIPKTERAACYLGVNTEGCTTWGEHSTNDEYKERGNHFDEYDDDLYILIDKKDSERKFQLSFESGEYMDRGDNPVDIEEIIGEDKKIKTFFMDEIINSDYYEIKRGEIYRPDYIIEDGMLRKELTSIAEILFDINGDVKKELNIKTRETKRFIKNLLYGTKKPGGYNFDDSNDIKIKIISRLTYITKNSESNEDFLKFRKKYDSDVETVYNMFNQQHTQFEIMWFWKRWADFINDNLSLSDEGYHLPLSKFDDDLLFDAIINNKPHILNDKYIEILFEEGNFKGTDKGLSLFIKRYDDMYEYVLNDILKEN